MRNSYTMDEQTDQLLLRVHPAELEPMGVEQALRYLAEQAVSQMPGCGAAQEIFDDAWKREQQEPTCLGAGLVLPHARVRGIKRPFLYAACSRNGLAWFGEEVHVVILLIVPCENPEVHLHLLSRVARWRRGLTEVELMALCESADKLSDSLLLAVTGS